MKLYDFDGMFDEKLSEYMNKNPEKYTESEWESVIPAMYKKFGDTFIKSVGDTPNGFYAKMSAEELVCALRTHLKKDAPVPGYLCDAIEKRNSAELLLPLLDGSQSEKEYAVNLLGADEAALKKYMELLVSPATDADLKENLLDKIKEKADLVKDKAIENYNKGTDKVCMLEILSRTVVPDDRVFDILLKAFRTDPDNIPVNAGYLAAYGDERALEYLLDKIDEEGITYIEYKELLIAIETLGGSYKKERDFSSDPSYGIIKSASVPVFDFPDDKKD